MADETPKYADGGPIPAGTWTTSTTGYPETIVNGCGYQWTRTELDEGEGRRE
ncbi:hypothetical protein ACFWU5_16440 [Nocardia sp. NPDC058640]|uniref:hypothetical protein n=1 Tax=Nocardia sp. NPDC058640 TaxID=3346571 RepID=UPI00364C519F